MEKHTWKKCQCAVCNVHLNEVIEVGSASWDKSSAPDFSSEQQDAIVAIASASDNASIDWLQRLIATRSGYLPIRLLSMFQLLSKDLCDEVVFKIASHAFKADRIDVRIPAFDLLASISTRNTNAKELAATALLDQSPEIRRKWCEFIESDESIKTLVKASQLFGGELPIAPLIRTALEDGDSTVRAKVITLLGRWELSACIPVLFSIYFKSCDPDKSTARLALDRIESATVIKGLTRVMRCNENLLRERIPEFIVSRTDFHSYRNAINSIGSQLQLQSDKKRQEEVLTAIAILKYLNYSTTESIRQEATKAIAEFERRLNSEAFRRFMSAGETNAKKWVQEYGKG